MTTVIKPKRGTTTPTTSDIVSGEVAVDTSAQKIYINDGGTVKIIGEDATTWSKNDSFAQIGTDTSTTTNSFLNIFDHTFGTNETAHFKIELNLSVVSATYLNSPNYGELFVDLYRTSSSPFVNFTYFPYDWESTLMSASNNLQYTYNTSGRFQIWIYKIYNNLLASGRLTNLTPTVTGGTYDNVHVDLDRSNAWTNTYTSLGTIAYPEYRDVYAEDYWGSNVYATYVKPGSSVQLTSSSKYILMGDSAQIRFGGSSDAKIWYGGSSNTLDIELESAAQSVNITDNGTDKFIFAKTGDLTVTGDIAVNGGDITSTTGQIALGNYAFDVDQTVSASEDNYVLTYDNTSGQISLEAAAAGGISNVVEDTTPQLGGNLDVNGNSIVSASAGNISITPDTTGSVIIDGLSHPQADGTTGQFLKTDGVGQLGFASVTQATGNELENVVEDTTPQLGGSLDVNGNKIVSVSNGNIDIEPNGTGNVLLGNFTFDADQTVGVGQDNYVLTYDNSAGTIGLEAATGGDLVNDTTPQLGGNLDVNGNKIVSVSNGNIDIEPNGTGNVLLGNFTFDADQTVGAGQDNYVLTYDNSTGTIGLEAVGVTFQQLEIKNSSGTTIKIKAGLGGGTTTLVKNSAGTTLNTVVGPFLSATPLVAGHSATADGINSFIGKQTIFIPASNMTPTASNGCSTLTTVETTAGRPDMNVLDFDATTDEHAQFQVAFPKSWNEGAVSFKAYWTVGAAVTTGVAWGLQGVAVSDNDTIDVAYGQPAIVTDDALNAAEDLCVSAESPLLTIAGSPAAEDMVFFRVFRDVSDVNDDMTEDARLIGIKLFFTTDTGNDG